MANFKQIKIKDNRVPLAHEVVFPDDCERNFGNCFRFLVSSYLYYKNTKISSITQGCGVPNNTMYRNLCFSENMTKVINMEVVKQVFSVMSLDLNLFIVIAKHFQLSTCNGISFTSSYVIFFNAFYENMSDED